MTREELTELRREATRWIRKLESLDGLLQRRKAIERLPDTVARLEWSMLEGLVSSPPRSALVWDWVLASTAAERIGDERALASFERRARAGRVEYLIWTELKVQDDATLEAVERYRTGVKEFAKVFLTDREWSSEVVHRAIRDDRPLRLPNLPPGPSVTSPARLRIDVEQGEEIPYDVIVAMNQFTALADEPELIAELGRRERTQTWKGWLRAMQKRLLNQTTNPTERGNVSDARRYLHAAATGWLPPDK